MMFKNKKDCNRRFSKEDMQMTNRYVKKVFSITNHQRNANQNHEVSPHPT
jgi:hypothetical protein